MSIYQFIFKSSLGELTLNHPPRNWDALKFSLLRDDTYKGIARKIAATFEFVKDGRKYLHNLEEKEGIDADLTVEIWRKKASGWNSKTLLSIYKADFKTYEINDITANIKLIDTSFAEKLNTRQDKKINLNSLTSLDGDVLTGIVNPYRTLELHDRTILLQNKHEINYNNAASVRALYSGFSLDTSIDFNIIYASNNNINNTVGLSYGVDGTYEPYSADSMILTSSESDIILNIKCDFKYGVFSNYSEGSLYIFAAEVNDDGYVINKNRQLVFTAGVNNVNVYTDVLMQAELNLFINKGSNCVIGLEADVSVPGGNVYLAIKQPTDNYNSILLSENIDYIEKSPTNCNVMLPHETGERLLQRITGIQKPLYSPVFGRKDLGYAEDGELAYIAQTNGLHVRQFPLEYTDEDGNEKETTLNTSFKEWFQSYNAIMPLAAYIEKYEGYERLVVDKLENIYNAGKVRLRLGQGEISDIIKVPLEKYYFNSVLCGYNDEEHESINGLSSPLGEVEYALPITNVSETYDIKSKYVTDDYAIALAQRKPYYSYPTEDTRYDKKNILIDTKLKSITSTTLICKRAEDFDTVTGVLSPTSMYNINLSPVRNLLRHKRIIAIGLVRKKNKNCIFVKGALNDAMVTKRSDESTTVYENQDIAVNDLCEPIFLPNLFKFKAKISFDQYNELFDYPNEAIEFYINKKLLYGFIETLDYNRHTGEAEFEVIQCNR